VACNPAPCCKSALAEATQLWPGRSKLSDGICPSAAHTLANPDSDHETGNAYDLTHDPKNGCDCGRLSQMIIGRRDPRVKYVIFNRKIYQAAKGWAAEDYHGKDDHTTHMHVSILESGRADVSPWFGGKPGSAAPSAAPSDTSISWGDALGIATSVASASTRDALPDALKPLASLVDLLGFLTDPSNWLRVAEFIGGVLLALGGVTLIVLDTRAGKAVANIGAGVATGGASVAAKAAMA